MGLIGFAAEAILWPLGIRRASCRKGKGSPRDSEQDGDEASPDPAPQQDDGVCGWTIDFMHACSLTGVLLAFWISSRLRATRSSIASEGYASPKIIGIHRLPLSEFLRLLRGGAVTAVTYVADRPPAGALLVTALPGVLSSAQARVVPASTADAATVVAAVRRQGDCTVAETLRCEDLDFEALARRTEGMSGADLAGLLNEAALLAARRRAEAVGMGHIAEVLRTPRPKQRRHGGVAPGQDMYGDAGDAADSEAQGMTGAEMWTRMLATMAAALVQNGVSPTAAPTSQEEHRPSAVDLDEATLD